MMVENLHSDESRYAVFMEDNDFIVSILRFLGKKGFGRDK